MSNNVIINQNTINLNNNQNPNNNLNNNINFLSTSLSGLNMSSCINLSNINEISKKINNEQELDAFLEHIKNVSETSDKENIQLHKDLLEVRNRPNTNYFDDEDFIYCRFELPIKIIEEISHSGKDFIDYFENVLNNFESNFEFENYEVYCNICILYQYITIYYSTIKNNGIETEDKYFSYDFLSIVKTVCRDVTRNCCLDSNNSGYNYFHDYTKEVMHGLRLIIIQLSAIITVLDCNNFQNINNYPIKYKTRVLRLINNMCVILLFMKFYYNQPDYNFETTEEEDSMTDFGNLVPAEWQIQRQSKKKIKWDQNLCKKNPNLYEKKEMDTQITNNIKHNNESINVEMSNMDIN